jgi:hypothetical protein
MLDRASASIDVLRAEVAYRHQPYLNHGSGGARQPRRVRQIVRSARRETGVPLSARRAKIAGCPAP